MARTCVGCGSEFEAKRRNARYCSRACYKSHWNRERHVSAVAPTVVCPQCGVTFTRSHNAQKFCSRACTQRWHRELASSRSHQQRTGMRRACVTCGNEFNPGRSNQKYCSPLCRSRSHAFQRREACPVCGGGFTWTHERRKYCSAECQSIGFRILKTQCNRRRKLRRQMLPHDVFDDIEVYERDHWVCGICGETVDPSLAPPHPLSKSIDHIQPLSRGGRHTKDNCRTAHLRCNMELYWSDQRDLAHTPDGSPVLYRFSAERVCPVCGSTFVTTHGTQKYCSQECRREQDRMSAARPRFTKICPHCGRTFETAAARQRCCSYKCANALRYPRALAVCPQCDARFEVLASRNGEHRYCSRACAARANGAAGARGKA